MANRAARAKRALTRPQAVALCVHEPRRLASLRSYPNLFRSAAIPPTGGAQPVASLGVRAATDRVTLRIKYRTTGAASTTIVDTGNVQVAVTPAGLDVTVDGNLQSFPNTADLSVLGASIQLAIFPAQQKAQLWIGPTFQGEFAIPNGFAWHGGTIAVAAPSDGALESQLEVFDKEIPEQWLGEAPPEPDLWEWHQRATMAGNSIASFPYVILDPLTQISP